MKRLALLLSIFILVGCAPDTSDLKTYVADIQSAPAQSIAPLPTLPALKTVTYQAQALRSPFEPDFKIEVLQAVGVRPDLSREVGPLEAYALDALRMVGTLSKQNQIWGLVVDNAGDVHRVQVGDYIGQNHGQVHTISEQEIIILELIPDGQGGWRERPATLTLAN